jgi:hypothetical protein
MTLYDTQKKYFHFIAPLYIQALLQSDSLTLKSLWWSRNVHLNSCEEKVL